MKRILIADDDVVAIRLCQMHLKRAGYESLVYQDGIHLSRDLEELEFDLAILDHDFPGKSGLEIIQSIRALEKFQDTPVIVVTGFMNPSLEAQFMEAGAQAVFSKPYSPLALLQTIDELANPKV